MKVHLFISSWRRLRSSQIDDGEKDVHARTYTNQDHTIVDIEVERGYAMIRSAARLIRTSFAIINASNIEIDTSIET